MRELEIEFILGMNEVYCATLLRAFCAEYTLLRTPTPLHFFYLVLPVTLHEETAEALGSVNATSGVVAALGKNRTLAVGLQWRMQRMASLTERSLQVASACKVLDAIVDKNKIGLAPSTKTRPSNWPANRRPEKAARNLGAWLSESPEQTLTLLEIVF